MGARALLDRLIAAGEDHQKAPQRALRAPSLRPYLPGRAHVRRVAGGLRVLARMAWAAGRAGLRRATAPPDPKAKKAQSKETDKPTTAKKDGTKKEEPGVLDTLERAGAAALVVVIALAAGAGVVSALWVRVAPYARTVAGVVVIAVLAAAWAVGPKTQTEKLAGEPEQPAAGGEAQPDPAPLPHAPEPLDGWTVVRTVRQIATANGWLGAHLDDILAWLPGRSREELLEVLAEAGIPVTEQLKLTLPGGRQRNRQGIRVSALPPAPAEAPTQATPGSPPMGPAEEVPDRTPPQPRLVVYGTE